MISHNFKEIEIFSRVQVRGLGIEIDFDRIRLGDIAFIACSVVYTTPAACVDFVFEEVRAMLAVRNRCDLGRLVCIENR